MKESKKRAMRKPGIEPGTQQWECWILPLNYLRSREKVLMKVGVVS